MNPLPLPARMVVTWLAIFPLVVLAQFLLGPVVVGWPPVFATALTMGLVVPIAVIWAVPLLSRWYARLFIRTAGEPSL